MGERVDATIQLFASRACIDAAAAGDWLALAETLRGWAGAEEPPSPTSDEGA